MSTDDQTPTPPADEFDALLRDWHRLHADRAAAGRDRLLAALGAHPASARDAGAPAHRHRTWRTVMIRLSPLAAVAAAIAILLPFILPGGRGGPAEALATTVVMAPEGGRLDALDPEGNALGPCELKHTDISAEISGPFARVTLRQRFHNPHRDKIEAVYTFPLSHRAAVDRMKMVIGDRVVLGEVKEREQARQIYESARAQGRIAGLLEQERPNIFTQAVANIEPGADIDIEISYVEILEPRDGEYSFELPTVVGPRYIPGAPVADPPPLPPHLEARRGLVLLGPASLSLTNTPTEAGLRPLSADELARILAAATPVRHPLATYDHQTKPTHLHGPLWHEFIATYADGSSEPGQLFADGLGHVNNRWFYTQAAARAQASPAQSVSSSEEPEIESSDAPVPGHPFSPDTVLVPDASRITPTPVRPSTRAGHDLSITVTLDTGGPGINALATPLHDTLRTDLGARADGLPTRTRLALRNQAEIPNRDFVLTWKPTSEAITDAVFTHTGDSGGFFAVLLHPPARVEDAQAVPRELVFVIDTSGSMSGLPIEKAKSLIHHAIDGMRPLDTFNLVTFAGDTRVLWDRPRPNTPANRAEAQAFLDSRSGGGGTEMMRAIETALRQEAPDHPDQPAPITLEQLADLPADGRPVTLEAPWDSEGGGEPDERGFGRLRVNDRVSIRFGPMPPIEGHISCPVGEPVLITGAWSTVDGDRALLPVSARWKNAENPTPRPLRIVAFLTDGYVGDDMAIIDAIRRHRATTRVFSFGIGDSVNRYLIDGMARAGGGEAEYVLIPPSGGPDPALEAAADAAVERFNRRTRSPLLTDIAVEFSDTLRVADVLPRAGQIPDLFDQRPLVILGRATAPSRGTLTIRGNAATGPWERRIDLDLSACPAANPAASSLPSLWARAQIGALMDGHLAAIQRGTVDPAVRQRIVQLGETFGIMSQYTSFVAVDYARVTVAGQPRLVRIPIELPAGTRWEGFFGEPRTSDTTLGRQQASASDLAFDGDLAPVRAEAAVGFDPEVAVHAAGLAGSPQISSGGHIQLPNDIELSSFDGGAINGLENRSRSAVLNFGPSPDSGDSRTPASANPRIAPASSSPEPETSFVEVPEISLEDVLPETGRELSEDTASTPPSRSVADLTQKPDRAANYFDHVAARLDHLAGAGAPVPHALAAAEAALFIIARADERDLPAARAAAELFHARYPAHALLAELDRHLHDDAQTQDQRRDAVVALTARARAEHKRELTLLARLDPALYTLARPADALTAAANDAASPARQGQQPPAPIAVVVLVGRVDPATTDRLAAAGLTVQSTAADASVVVGEIEPTRLADLALVEGVRRIDLFQPAPTAPE